MIILDIKPPLIVEYIDFFGIFVHVPRDWRLLAALVEMMKCGFEIIRVVLTDSSR